MDEGTVRHESNAVRQGIIAISPGRAAVRQASVVGRSSKLDSNAFTWAGRPQALRFKSHEGEVCHSEVTALRRSRQRGMSATNKEKQSMKLPAMSYEALRTDKRDSVLAVRL